MLSHHIIREKQEPALLVLGLDNFEDELLGQLLEWSPTLIVTADTAEQLNAFGIKYDALVGDELVDSQADIKYIALGAGTCAEAALKYLIANNYPAVNVVTDELVLSDYLPYAPAINMVIFNAGKKIYPITSGFAKWKPDGEIIEVLSDADNLTCTGLTEIEPGSYITNMDGFFTFSFSAPYLFIAELIA